MNKLLLPLVFLFPVSIAFGQNYFTKKTAPEKAIKYYKSANNLALNHQYVEAVEEIDRALKKCENFVDAYLLRSDIYFELNNLMMAEKDLEKAVFLAPDYKSFNHYKLGEIKFQSEKYSESQKCFKKYVNYPKISPKMRDKALQRIESCEFIAKAKMNPVPFNPVNLGEGVNSTNAEYLPSFSVDGQTLIYTRRIRGQEDFYKSSREGENWGKGEDLGYPINTDMNEGAQSISADGKSLVYTICNDKKGLGSCDLYFSAFENSKWSKPVNMGTPVCSSAWESQPSLSANGKYLLFTSNRTGGKGGKDIWMATKKSDGSWNKPEPLPGAVNTKADESTPFLHPDGKTLYFMSNGHTGFGGEDLFVSRKGKDGNWQTPKNLGYPINTPKDEGSIVVSFDGKKAYFASDIGNKPGDLDIFSFDLYQEVQPSSVTYVQASLFDSRSKKSVEGEIEIRDLGSDELIFSSSGNAKEEYLVCLPAGTDYSLNVSKEGYLFYSQHFALANLNEISDPYDLKIMLQPIPVRIASNPAPTAVQATPASTEPIILRNVFFKSGSAKILESSATELTKLNQLLVQNPNMKIQINGHTDNVGSADFNFNLSKDRAQAVKDYLVRLGIDQNRLTSKGFGESLPIETNSTEEGKQANRRTEFIIL